LNASLKILLSAYACEPKRGSEPGVGWHWAIELSRLGHEVWVLTRANNRQATEASFLQCPKPANLHFLYYDLPAGARWWKKGGRGVHLYYLLWQWGAYRFAKQENKRNHFDLVHHVTFVSVRQPSFMGNLGIPFIFGPVAGGERAPWRLRLGYGLRGFLLDALRDFANLLVRVDPFMRRNFKQASKIYATSEQTRALIPQKYRHKVFVQLGIDIGEEMMNKSTPVKLDRLEEKSKPLLVLYVGRFVYWKGMHLGLRAFAQLVASGVDARLTMVGKGPDKKRWQKLSAKLGIEGRIEWIPWVSREELSAIYAGHDIFLFPSLHDSGGMVVLEAMAHGLPVICLKLGGPGKIVNKSCGVVIETSYRTQNEIVKELASAFNFLINKQKYAQTSHGALHFSQRNQWISFLKSIYTKGKLPDIHNIT